MHLDCYCTTTRGIMYVIVMWHKHWNRPLYIQIFCVESLCFRSCKPYSGLEKSTHPLAMTSTSCCRGSRNYDEVIEFTKNIWAYRMGKNFPPLFPLLSLFYKNKRALGPWNAHLNPGTWDDVLAILVEGIMRNISVKLFWIWTSGLGENGV